MTTYRSFAPVILGFLLWSVPASLLAQSGETGNVCVRDFQPGAVCTANDVRIEALVPLMVLEDCASGVVGETEVVFEVLVSAAGSPDRFDIGLFLALDGGDARDGDSCFHDFLDPPLTATPTLGDANMDGIMDIDGGPWLDNDGDGCGDIGTNTQVLKNLPALRFACIDSNMDGSADVSVCTSWDNNAGTVCNDIAGAFPGTNSKCSCDAVELGIVPVVPTPGIAVSKDPPTQAVVSGGSAVFTITVDNSGNADLTNVVVSDPQCTTLTGPTGDTNTNNVLETTETWSYTCTVTNVTSGFTNTAMVTATPPTGPDVSDSDSADVTVPAPDAPAVSALKTSALVLDNDGSGSLTPADTLEYTILIDNGGSGDALDVMLTDVPDSSTALVVGTVTTTQGTVTSGNGVGDTDVVVDIGTLAASGQVTVTFEVDIDDPLPDGVSVVSNQGVVSGSNFADVPTDDPTTVSAGDPTDDAIAGTIPMEIPTVSEWGLILLSLLLAALAIARMRRRSPAASRDREII